MSKLVRTWSRLGTIVLTVPLAFAALATSAGAVSIAEHTAGLVAQQWPAAITAGPDGNVWFTYWGCGSSPTPVCGIGRITPTAGITAFPGGTTPGLQAGTFPVSIATGSNGNLWFADSSEGGASHEIGQITPSGTVTESPTGLSSTAFASDVTLGPDGHMWALINGTTPAVGRIEADGSITKYTLGVPPSSTLRRITTGADGNLWFTDTGATSLIERITPAGAITPFFFGLPSGSTVQGITAGPDGDLWFTAFGPTPAIGRINSASGAITVFTAGLNSGSAPVDITTGPDGNLWFADNGVTPAIGRITPAGAITEFTSGLNPVSNPHAITAGPDGSLWFTDQACNGRPASCAIGQLTLQLPPAVSTGAASALTTSGAHVGGTVNPLGGPVSSVAVRYTVPGHSAQTVSAAPASLPAGGKAVPISASLSGLPPAATVSYQVVATNAFGTTAGPTATFRTLATPVPAVTHLHQSHNHWRAANRRAHVSRRARAPIGTTFSFSLNEPARVQLAFTRALPGRRAGGHCVAPSARSRHGRRCTRNVAAGQLSFTGHAGTNRVAFYGKLSARRVLSPGSYTVAVSARAARTSPRRTLRFTVVVK